jgi:conjugative relaxase-like TrwC/TraI family protein
MLRIIQSTNAAGASRYYTEGLKREDYYTKGAEVEGVWHGQTLELVGLATGSGDTKKQFKALLNNRHPVTGKKLTPRMNAETNRTPGWDFVFSVPKSVSLLHALNRDPEILAAFRDSVAETMAEIEKRIATRVRIKGKQEDRVAGNMAWCEFIHTTTRPLEDGIPDAHLHIHGYVFNLCFDPVEERFKAAKIREIKDNAYYYEALFDSLLSQKLGSLGLATERTAKGWELSGLNAKSLLEKFSRRTAEIEKASLELGITDARDKDKLGAKTRNRKNSQLTEAELVKAWTARLTPDELTAVHRTAKRAVSTAAKVTVDQALDFAQAKCFERESVVARNRIVAAALKFGVGSVTLNDVNREMQRRNFIQREIDGELKVTTAELVAEEALMIQRVRDGRSKLAPLLKGRLNFIQDFLSKEQREAVRHILKTHDQVIALRGIAGSGKTTLLTEVRQQLEHQGIRMVALAPSAQASRGVLRDEGFQGAETIANFLASKELQQRVRGQVLLIDEAGTIPNRELNRILELAGSSTRVILSGDTGQHAPVGRGDSMRLLENYAGLPVATVRQIRRQESANYRQAVEAMSERDLKSAFARLDEINAILEIPDDSTRYRRLALDYAQCLVETGIAPLVVSPTHAEGRMAVNAIREYLKELGHLGKERNFLQYRQLKWEVAEMRRPENYEAGQMVQFHQNVPGVKRGSILPVLGVDSTNRVWVELPGGKQTVLDLSRSEHFRVYEIGEICFAPGDSIKLTNGGKDVNGRRLENGTLSTVKHIAKDGRLTLVNGMVLKPDFGHFAYGYDTSHSSQGKTAREVLVAQSSRSFRAGSTEQFYVSISRGRERLKIYTDDRINLQAAVGNSARRMSALELTGLGHELFIMDGGLSGKKWTERIAANKAQRLNQLKSHADRVMAERGHSPAEGKIISFADYVEMRRANVTADGKSRSKGHPQANRGKRQGQKGMVPDPRGNQKSSADLEQKPEAQAKPKSETTKPEPKKAEAKASVALQTVEKAVSASARNLREVVGRTERGAKAIKEGAERQISIGKLKTTLGKLTGNSKTKSAQVKHEATRKPTPPKPKPPTPTPTIRRGR